MSVEAEVDTETEETNESSENVNFLSMSDDEVANFDFNSLDSMGTQEKQEETEEEKNDSSIDSEDTESAEKSDTEVEDSGESEESDAEQDDDSEESDDSNEDENEDENEDDENTDKEDSSEISPEEIVKQLFTPFKANGKTMQIQNVDDAVTLIKMGANYNKKMHILKPHLKLVKMLENNGLTEEGQLNYLIDLHNKNPDAVKKLVKDSGIDVEALDDEQDNTYEPNTYNVSDKEVDLDLVLEDIRETPKFKDTIEVISNKWDTQSKTILSEKPGIIRAINDHMHNGIYEKISNAVEHERMLGRLLDVPDIIAYKQIGDAMEKAGAFAPEPSAQPKEHIKIKPDPKVDSLKESERKNRKKSASPTKTVVSKKKAKVDFNPLSLSDEEFSKLTLDKYI